MIDEVIFACQLWNPFLLGNLGSGEAAAEGGSSFVMIMSVAAVGGLLALLSLCVVSSFIMV